MHSHFISEKHLCQNTQVFTFYCCEETMKHDSFCAFPGQPFRTKKQNAVLSRHVIASLLLLPVLFVMFAFSSCATTPSDPMKRINDAWLSQNEGELFRVVMMSNDYRVSQNAYQERMSRAEDSGGDQFFMERLRRYDIIDRETEGVIRVQLYPNNGRLMKVRFLQSTSITEIDKMITDDIQRWSFNFNGPVSPTSFSIRYRVVLRRNSTAQDDEVQAELQKKRRRR